MVELPISNSMSAPEVAKEGWLLKRGEYIRAWRPRYFQLKTDGTFRGYKQQPTEEDNPVNVFEIGNSTIAPDDPVDAKKGKYGFKIRFMQLTRVIERAFHTETKEERDAWMEAYVAVQKNFSKSPSVDQITERCRAMSFIDAKPKPCDISMDDFDHLKVLGRGTFGEVFLSREKKTQKLYAMKVLRKNTIIDKGELVHTLTENSVLAKCSHPFLTALAYSFQTKDFLCFVLEYVNGGEVFYHLRKEKRFSEPRAKFYIAEITVAMTYLHDQNIIYRDLKLENLLLDKDGHIKITDFGLCKQEVAYGVTTSTFCGTPEYLAPEVLQEAEYTRAVDWWGTGAVFYEMVVGHLPFRGKGYEEIFEHILNEPVELPAISEHGRSLIDGLLKKDPKERLGASPRDGLEVMEHPYFSDIDFAKLNRRGIEPPWKPVVKDELDVSNFDPYFTQEKVTGPSAEDPAGSAVTDAERDESFEAFESVAKTS
eukprot:m.58125 g.58125  ORF g.58125 m.58125 type:complete len:481 (+) comp7124_c0_seq1:1-1443(+)